MKTKKKSFRHALKNKLGLAPIHVVNCKYPFTWEIANE